MKAKSARYGANIERVLMVRKIKAVFLKFIFCKPPGSLSSLDLYDAENALLMYAAGQAARSKAKKGGL